MAKNPWKPTTEKPFIARRKNINIVVINPGIAFGCYNAKTGRIYNIKGLDALLTDYEWWIFAPQCKLQLFERTENMKTSELILALQNDVDQNGDRIIIMQRDPEGNSYSPFSDLWTGIFFSGEAYLEKLTADDIKNGYTSEDVRTDGEPAVFLVPLY